MENLTKETFKEKLFDYENEEKIEFKFKKPVVLTFSASFCKPCKSLAPVLEELNEEFKEQINFYKIDIDDQFEITEYFKIKSIPTVIFFPNDESTIKKQVGVVSKKTYKELIENILLKETEVI